MATLRIRQPLSFPAEDLKKAFEGWGTDEKTVIAILAHRDAVQRKEIMIAYEELYNENFITRLKKELSGDLERAVYYWIFDPIEREAIMANDAVKKRIDYRVIVEIACINSPSKLLAIRQAYHTRYKLSLEEDVASHTNGDLRKLLVAVVSSYRFEGEVINENLAQLEAKTFHDAVFALKSTNGTQEFSETLKQRIFHHDEVIRILGTRSKAQLNATFHRYKDEYGISVNKDLSHTPRDDFIFALRTALRCIIEPQKYYGKILCSAIDRAGTDEDALTRVMVTCAETDLKEIKEIYKEKTNVTLENAVSQETSGDYKDFLLTLIGED